MYLKNITLIFTFFLNSVILEFHESGMIVDGDELLDPRPAALFLKK
jgi:hypothetical protein